MLCSYAWEKYKNQQSVEGKMSNAGITRVRWGRTMFNRRHRRTGCAQGLKTEGFCCAGSWRSLPATGRCGPSGAGAQPGPSRAAAPPRWGHLEHTREVIPKARLKPWVVLPRDWTEKVIPAAELSPDAVIPAWKMVMLWKAHSAGVTVNGQAQDCCSFITVCIVVGPLIYKCSAVF